MAEGAEGVEVVGRTVDEAVQHGLEVLQLKREQVNVEIVSDGARTMFGFRPGQVRVRVTPKASTAVPQVPEAAREAVTAPEGPISGEGAEADTARHLLTEMLNRMGIRAQVEVVPSDTNTPLRLNITGKNLGMLIGRRGETLASLQFLIRLMVSHQLHRWVNLIVDVDDYRQKREETLRRLAVRMAQAAIESGRVQELEPMPPGERRIIHLALRDFGGVTTQSLGEGESRRVTIIPSRSRQA
ncbi:MAG: RNA-binding cell elongation regulator Jag/EloR [Anaerolineae bacterium]